MFITVTVKLKPSATLEHAQRIGEALAGSAGVMSYVQRTSVNVQTEAGANGEAEVVDESALKLRLPCGAKIRLTEREGFMLHMFMHLQPVVVGGRELFDNLALSAPHAWPDAIPAIVRNVYSRLSKKLRGTSFPLCDRPKVYGLLQAARQAKAPT